MRKIIVVTFSTMDGVLQAPGGPNEDTMGGFKWGGWQFGYPDELTNDALGKIFSTSFDLLLGRRTYEIFSAYWPYQNDTIGGIFNRINKYVVATTPVDTSWKNSVLINKDVVNELKKLKAQDGPDLLVHGSSRLVQTLLANRLVDVLHLWIYPITLGKGKKLFEEGTQAQEWKMTESVVSKTTGVIIATYVPGGEVKLGSVEQDVVSDAEIERRKKWKKEEGK
ncbi:MAG TPA: dihydrofolate reductase family protein [Puia sp.]